MNPEDLTQYNNLNQADKQMIPHGICQTVYGFLYPEVEEILAETLSDPGVLELYRKGYLKEQDTMGSEFTDRYVEWISDVVDIDRKEFAHTYPGAGSAEVIREMIALQASAHLPTYRKVLETKVNFRMALKALSKLIGGGTSIAEMLENKSKDKPSISRLHMFTGDYEGYPSYATPHHLEVVRHSRENYRKTLCDIHPGDTFYMSHPSGIDGNVWSGYDDFMHWAAEHAPKLQVFLDLAYVGTIPHTNYHINATYPNIRAIFYSLSKAFGVFYQRIGGMLSREKVDSLYGNEKWFKNILNAKLGTNLMDAYALDTLPKLHQETRDALIDTLKQTFGNTVTPSDVLLLATQEIHEHGTRHPIQKALEREGLIRYCLTPGLDQHSSST